MRVLKKSTRCRPSQKDPQGSGQIPTRISHGSYTPTRSARTTRCTSRPVRCRLFSFFFNFLCFFLFVITYLLDDEQELSMGMLIRPKRIYIFLMLHACFVTILLCFMCTFPHFLAFSGTNLLTQCRNASSCFLLFLCFKKVVHESFSELDETKAHSLIFPG
jgi:hypothetical protein